MRLVTAAELTGQALIFAVGQAAGVPVVADGGEALLDGDLPEWLFTLLGWSDPAEVHHLGFDPLGDIGTGAAVLWHFKIATYPHGSSWCAVANGDLAVEPLEGITPQEAGCRALVADKLGPRVLIPESLFAD